MLQQLTVTGAKSFNDTVEGTLYNTTKIGVLLPVKKVESDTQNAVGFETIYIQLNDSTEFHKYKMADVPYPCVAEVDIEMTSKGYVANSFKPLAKAQIVKA